MYEPDEEVYIEDVWDQQKEYNIWIKQLQKRKDAEWMINYILGSMSELSQLLDQTNWKQHRVQSIHDFGPNIAEELADLTKYVFSMWQLIGYTPERMLKTMFRKGKILEQLYRQEHRPDPTGKKILMLDLDGVLADFRTGFGEWLEVSDWAHKLPIKHGRDTIHMDINNGWDYNTYNEAKLQFEQDGGYGTLPCCIEVRDAVKYLQSSGWYVIVHTARPFTVYKRIWEDTWLWLIWNDLEVDELHFGHDNRIKAALALQRENQVVALEDDPTLVQRYLASNIPVCMVQQPYNQVIPYLPGMEIIPRNSNATFIFKCVESSLSYARSTGVSPKHD